MGFRLSPACFTVLACLAAPPQEPTGYLVERVTWGFRAAAGPAWSPEGFLLFCDPPEAKLYKFVPGQKVQLFREASGRASNVGYDESGRLYIAETGSRRVSRQGPKGEPAQLAGTWEGKPLNGPFDLAVRKDGHVFFTDPAFGAADDAKELPFYGVYHVSPKGEVSLLSRMARRPSGIALAPNARTLYVAGADERVVRAWDLDRGGKAENERILITGVEGVPLGLRTDEKGNVWVAANQLLQYSPEGKLLRKIPLPETPSGLAFAAPDASVIYVTAQNTVYRVRKDTQGLATP